LKTAETHQAFAVSVSLFPLCQLSVSARNAWQ
jgi:hypothetical protein